MRIDKTHKSWLLASILILAASLVIYVPYAMRAPSGPRGSSFIGLTFGIVGYGFMLFAGLLGARKKVAVWRIGRAQTWMRGHLWLGLLSLPLILFHAGFAFRGPLTAVLMILLFIVVFSGLSGAALQHYLPTLMTQRVPLETIYEEIPHVRSKLVIEAEQIAATIARPPDASGAFANGGAGSSTILTLIEMEQEERARFHGVFMDTIKPFLEHPDAPGSPLRNPIRSTEVFDGLRRGLPVATHAVLGDLESICEEERQLRRQIRLYQLLHGWLLVHVPLSVVLLVLGAVHAIVAFRY